MKTTERVMNALMWAVIWGCGLPMLLVIAQLAVWFAGYDFTFLP